jgi:hypothetical protein
LVNVRIELTITDERGGSSPVKKTITVIAADANLSRIRSNTLAGPPIGEVPLNVDVMPGVRQGGKIRLMITLQYDLPSPPGEAKGATLYKTAISETLNIIVDDGKPLVVAQSADPVSDRRVTIEVRATVLK